MTDEDIKEGLMNLDTVLHKKEKRKVKNPSEKSLANLKKYSEFSAEERREFARIGGKASAAARKKKKNVQEVLGALLASPANDEMRTKFSEMGINIPEDATLYDALGLAVVKQALDGNVYAFTVVRDSAGDKPVDKVETKVENMTPQDIEIMNRLEARLADKSTTDGQDT